MTVEKNSIQKLDVGFYRKEDGSRWVYVDLLKYAQRPNPPLHPRLIPSFWDIRRIVLAIGDCEDEKYPPPANGKWQLLNFLRDAMQGMSPADLARKYKIPERDGDEVTNTNGAKIAAREPAQLSLAGVYVAITDREIPF